MDAHVVSVIAGWDEKKDLYVVGMPDEKPKFYDRNEGPSSAVIRALESVSRGIARWEIPADDGFTVRVVFKKPVDPLLQITQLEAEKHTLLQRAHGIQERIDKLKEST